MKYFLVPKRLAPEPQSAWSEARANRPQTKAPNCNSYCTFAIKLALPETAPSQFQTEWYAFGQVQKRTIPIPNAVACKGRLAQITAVPIDAKHGRRVRSTRTGATGIVPKERPSRLRVSTPPTLKPWHSRAAAIMDGLQGSRFSSKSSSACQRSINGTGEAREATTANDRPDRGLRAVERLPLGKKVPKKAAILGNLPDA
jgi:hypothetical protein